MIDNVLKVITKVKNISEGSTISKISGVCKYKLSKGFPFAIYDEIGKKINNLEGLKDIYFIYDKEKGTFNIIDKDTEVVWYIEKEEFLDLLVEENDERESK